MSISYIVLVIIILIISIFSPFHISLQLRNNYITVYNYYMGNYYNHNNYQGNYYNEYNFRVLSGIRFFFS